MAFLINRQGGELILDRQSRRLESAPGAARRTPSPRRMVPVPDNMKKMQISIDSKGHLTKILESSGR